ncbi:isochorismate synthase [Halovivax cerinus]|uniref:isochorismate synthase n=1 Tax=Halovivax cerinus TaxID=1487865 RepID=A0ABD5NSA4_9EURY|nr:isochorismate synthase [Halovivax cerinus]
MVSAPGGHTASSTTERPALTSRSRRLGDGSIAGILDTVDDHGHCWSAPDGLELVGRGVATELTVTRPDRIERVRDRAAELFAGIDHDGPPASRPRAVGGFTFHGAREGGSPPNRTDETSRDRVDETAPGARRAMWRGFPPARFVVPTVQVTVDDGERWVTVVDREDEVADRLGDVVSALESAPRDRTDGPTPTIENRARSTTTDEWHRQVDEAVHAIATTDLEKIVLAQALTVDLDQPVDPISTLGRLGGRYPECYRFSFDGTAGGTFFGAPPERLIAKRGDRFETEALAGSVPRGETPDEDSAHAERLRHSDKLDAEHAFVVDAIRSNLDPIAESLTVDTQQIKRLATIQHLQTPMFGRLDGGTHVLDVVAALHPTPAVGGVPQSRACESIRSIEPIDRGWYAAPIGWFDAHGDGEFAVGIRSGVANGTALSVFAGNGIVAGSDAAEEADEIELKLRSIIDEFGRETA